jgi:TRAP-type C4-dicarboxylate transport system substrate-binding protein
MKPNSLILSVAVAVAGTLLAACGEPAGRTGSGTDPVSLTTYEAGPDEFLGRLAAGTVNSAVAIATVPNPNANGDGDTAALAALASGDLDLALIRSGRLTTEGAASLAPLGAPFLVSNNDQAIAIARDPVTEDLLADLPKIGLVGLGLVPMGVRHPFGYGEPLLGAADYAGQTINGRVDAAILDALGARLDTSVNEERTRKVQSGELRGIEISLQIFGAVDRPAVVTSNVNLYQRFDVVVIRRAAWDGLTTDQQDQVRSAVAKARDEAYAAMGTEEALFGEWCREPGAGSAQASPEQLASLHAALDPVTEALAAQHGPVIDRLRTLHEGTSEPSGLDCPAADASTPAWATLEPTGDQGVLDGTWRFANDEDELVAAGLTPSDANGNAGVWEMVVNGGDATLALNGGRSCSSKLTFAGDQVLFFVGPEEWCGGYMRGTYSTDGDTVRFQWGGDGYGLVLANGLFGEAVRVQG